MRIVQGQLFAIRIIIATAVVGAIACNHSGPIVPPVQGIRIGEYSVEIDTAIMTSTAVAIVEHFATEGVAITALWTIPQSDHLLGILIAPPAEGVYGPQLAVISLPPEPRILQSSKQLYDDDFINPAYFMFADRVLLVADHGSEDAYGVLVWDFRASGVRDLGEIPVAHPEGPGIFTRGAARSARVVLKNGRYVITFRGPLLVDPRGMGERLIADESETASFCEINGGIESCGGG